MCKPAKAKVSFCKECKSPLVKLLDNQHACTICDITSYLCPLCEGLTIKKGEIIFCPRCEVTI